MGLSLFLQGLAKRPPLPWYFVNLIFNPEGPQGLLWERAFCPPGLGTLEERDWLTLSFPSGTPAVPQLSQVINYLFIELKTVFCWSPVPLGKQVSGDVPVELHIPRGAPLIYIVTSRLVAERRMLSTGDMGHREGGASGDLGKGSRAGGMAG